MRMHPDETDVSVDLVARLIAGQFPHWADLPIRPVTPLGTVNAIFRLGDDLVVRLPRVPWGSEDVLSELRWLPRLARYLPVAVPVPVAAGRPTTDYPWTWSVGTWLDGENPHPDRLTDPGRLAVDLAGFIRAFRRIDLPDGPAAYRGGPLAKLDGATRAAIGELGGVIDTESASTVWTDALRLPEWDGPAVWVHADLMPGNLLVTEGRLSGVIDFATAGVGDPAGDLIVAWNLLPAAVRTAFRSALGVDDATWARGRARALSIALIALPYYQHTNPAMAGNARHTIDRILADHLAPSA